MNQVEGSKPKKFITRTVLTNPSLYSLSVTSIFDPENRALPKIYQALEQKQQTQSVNQSRIFAQLNPERFLRQASERKDSNLRRQLSNLVKPISNIFGQVDSLKQAEKQFVSRKTKQAQAPKAIQKTEPLKKQISQSSNMSRGNSLPSLFGYNYGKTRDIKYKQSKPYNIINNL